MRAERTRRWLKDERLKLAQGLSPAIHPPPALPSTSRRKHSSFHHNGLRGANCFGGPRSLTPDSPNPGQEAGGPSHRMQPSHLTFVSDGRKIEFFYKGQLIGQREAEDPNTLRKEAAGVLEELARGEGDRSYSRCIREIQEGRKFPVFYTSFNAYVKDWPEAELLRRWMTHKRPRQSLIFQGAGQHPCLAGGYLWAELVHFNDQSWGVCVNVGDAESVFKAVADQKEGQDLLLLIQDSSPIAMPYLYNVLGFALV